MDALCEITGRAKDNSMAEFLLLEESEEQAWWWIEKKYWQIGFLGCLLGGYVLSQMSGWWVEQGF